MERDPRSFLVFLAVVVGLIVRLLKSGRMETFLARFGAPPIPKKVLPWLALGFGSVGAVLEQGLNGVPWDLAAWSVLEGVVAGALAVAGNETLKPLVMSLFPALGKLIFGDRLPPPAPKE